MKAWWFNLKQNNNSMNGKWTSVNTKFFFALFTLIHLDFFLLILVRRHQFWESLWTDLKQIWRKYLLTIRRPWRTWIIWPKRPKTYKRSPLTNSGGFWTLKIQTPEVSRAHGHTGLNSTRAWRVRSVCRSSPVGAADSIREYYRESGGQELRVNRAVSDSRSTVNESAWLRKAAEAKLDATEREFNLKHQLHIQRLDKIKSELDSSDLSRLSRQVNKWRF